MLMLCRLGVLIMYSDVCDKGTFMCMWYPVVTIVIHKDPSVQYSL